jgi:hypothetical protein
MALLQNRVSARHGAPGVLPARRTTPRVKHAPCGPVFLPADRGPGAARERIAFIRARGPQPAPTSESALAKGALGERDVTFVTLLVTFVKRTVALSGTLRASFRKPRMRRPGIHNHQHLG